MAQDNKPTKIIPGIHQITLPLRDNPANEINTYLIEGNNEIVLIDTGWEDPEALDDLSCQLNHLKLKPEDISRVIYTHIHPDHFGLAGILKQRFGTELVVHRIGKELIEYRYFGRETFIPELGDYHILHGGTQAHWDAVVEMSTIYIDHVVPVLPDTLLQGNEIISIEPFTLEAIWTPGHEQDHICFYEPTHKLLFSGDHILPDTIPHVGMQVETSVNPLGNYLKSLQKIRHVNAVTVLPGHECVFGNLQQRVDELLSYHQKLQSEILEIIRHKPCTAYEIASQISWMENPVIWNKLPPMVQAGLVSKTLAYLEAFQIEKKVERLDKPNGTVYNAV